MIIIADSGSTKTDWALVDKQSGKTIQFTTSGLNPVVLGQERVRQILISELLPNIADTVSIRSIRFYGAGCTPAMIPVVKAIFADLFHEADDIVVASDMVGAAIAACGSEMGVAAILGTGSNSCLFDGEKIIQNTPCLGYILGDEGGGAVMGKAFLNGILKGTLPAELRKVFFQETGLTQESIIREVYRGDAPNRFLASMSLFIHNHLDVPELRALVIHNFRMFFRNNITQYGHPEMPVNFVGSMASHYSDELHEAARQEGFKVGKLIKSPIDGLVAHFLSI